ncbi:Probable ATP-dependent RNA helicase DDX56, partial [Geodia barretti]
MGDDGGVQFHDLGLDDRLLKAIAKLGWANPTLIQEKAIPLALEGKDLLIKAKTGSGKTAAYALPLLQKILQSKSSSTGEPVIRGLVIVPTKELSSQATKNLKELSASCSGLVRVLDVCNCGTAANVRTALTERPDIVVGTPSRMVGQIAAVEKEVLKYGLEVLVMDEADLLFSFGYEENIKTLLSLLPPIYQSFLLSATLSDDVKSLKKLVLHNSVTLRTREAEDEGPTSSRLTQFHIKCSRDDKFLLIYTLLKLGLVKGKTLLFVNEIEGCYRLKLFLEQFSIRACVLNSELPHNSRCHTVEEFNRGIYDYVVATDEVGVANGAGGREGSGKGRKRKRDREYGVCRGVDFQGVENVVNFDFPPTPESYIHRVGRTARGVDCGTALSLISQEEEAGLAAVEDRLSSEGGESSSSVIKPYRFKMSEIEGFRYRITDALRAVTKASIREARLKEIRVEAINSERLKSHFEDNPRDLQVLRHDQVLQPKRVQPHLKHIPSYLSELRTH